MGKARSILKRLKGDKAMPDSGRYFEVAYDHSTRAQRVRRGDKGMLQVGCRRSGTGDVLLWRT